MQPSILSTDPAKLPKPRGATFLIRFLIYAGAAVALLLTFFAAEFFFWARCFELRAFVSRSGSMCPAVC